MNTSKEIYEYKHLNWVCVLVVNDDDSMTLTEYVGDKQPRKFNDVKIVGIGRNGGERVQYSNDGVSLPFKNYNDGELDKRWKKIK